MNFSPFRVLNASLLCIHLITFGFFTLVYREAIASEVLPPTPDQINHTLTIWDDRDLDDLFQEARTLTHQLIEQAFSEHPHIPAVTVQILTEHNGAIVPLLITSVSRLDWRSHPQVEQWHQSLGRAAQMLLGMSTPTSAVGGRSPDLSAPISTVPTSSGSAPMTRIRSRPNSASLSSDAASGGSVRRGRGARARYEIFN